MKKINISIVICVADDNRLKQMLDSIYCVCEVILVLNGATDEIRKIARDFKSNTKCKVKIFEIEDKNLSKARNIGTKNATYNKVVHYDSDCIMVKGALEEYDKYLNNYYLVDGKVKFRNDTFSSKIISKLRNMGIPGYALCPSVGINKKIIKYIDYYFDEDIKWVEDTEMNRRVKRNNLEVGFIQKLTCIHDNLTFKQDLKSAYRYGYGAKLSVKKGIRKKGKIGNWFLTPRCFSKSILLGLYSVAWNICFAIGYLIN